MNRARGFTLIEIIVAAGITVAGALLVTQALKNSERAARADDARLTAARVSDALLRRVGQDLAQSSAAINVALPPEQRQRLWILSNGVTFQQIPADAAGDDNKKVSWSRRISYLHNATLRQVTRSVEGGTSIVVAHGVVAFACRRIAGGRVSVALETRVGAADDGLEAIHQRTIQVTPRNGLR
ncbi:MAG: type II secretion system GspH family protein [Planctomycetota bacterium]|nr:type II secretion system GspH family protein [Planctomycetota bacterium]